MSPQKWVQDKLEMHPSGTYLPLEATVEGVPLVFTGYKYNRRKVIFSVMTKGAAPTTPGLPYIAKWATAGGNMQAREVSCPYLR